MANGSQIASKIAVDRKNDSCYYPSIMNDWIPLKEAATLVDRTEGHLRKLLNQDPPPIRGRQIPWGKRVTWEVHKDDIPLIRNLRVKPEKALNYENLIKRWKEEQKNGLLTGDKLSPNTVDRNHYGMLSFWEYLDGDRKAGKQHLDRVTLENLRLAVSKVDVKDIAKHNNILMAVRSFYKLLIKLRLRSVVDAESLTEKEFQLIKNKKPKQTKLKQGEFEELLTQNQVKINGRSEYEILMAETMACLFFHTGMRRGEAMSLELSDIDLREGVIYIPDNIGECKTGAREVGIRPELNAQIKKYLGKRPASKNKRLLLRSEGIPVQKKYVNRTIRAFGALMDIPITPQAFRSYFITDLLRKGRPLALVMTIVGHKGYETTKGYDKNTSEDALDILRGGNVESKKQPEPEYASVNI